MVANRSSVLAMVVPNASNPPPIRRKGRFSPMRKGDSLHARGGEGFPSLHWSGSQTTGPVYWSDHQTTSFGTSFIHTGLCAGARVPP